MKKALKRILWWGLCLFLWKICPPSKKSPWEMSRGNSSCCLVVRRQARRGEGCDESVGAHPAGTRAAAMETPVVLLVCSQGVSCPDFFLLSLGNRENSPARRGGQERFGKVERGGEDEAARRGRWPEAVLPCSVQGHGQKEQCHGRGK